MEKKYYFRSLIWGIGYFCLSVYIWKDHNKIPIYSFFFCISAFFFPLSKRLIENIALRYTTREFWTTGIFMETSGKSGGYALFYMFCFIFSIPLGALYLIYLYIKK
ncbi:colicin E1 family microcin immunity protein [Pseudomonas sp. O64]|uniref:colicin E1 family microcin immunity protein n=1 Tax=unclassified Pseudomonas TaxID=196821 RepID=UPI0022022BAF|nr:hypothetical protein KZH41_09490 [Pseudomonas sp. YeP6b]